jgi:hypothetical protein
MAQKLINQGPGNLIPDWTNRKYLCSAAITAGDVVTLTGVTGYTIVGGSAILCPIGVAVETGVAGAWIDVCVRGFCALVTNNGDNQTEGDFLYAGATATADAGVYGTTDVGAAAPNGIAGGIFGITLMAEYGTSSTACFIMPGIL